MATNMSQAKAKELLEVKDEKKAAVAVIENTVQQKEQDIHCNKITIS